MAKRVTLVALAGLCGCGAFDSVPTGALTRCEQVAVLPGAAKTDILFVVDDSASMGVEQSHLATSFRSFIEALAASPVKNDYQIAITNTSVDLPRYDQGDSGPYTILTNYEWTAGNPPYPAGAFVAAPNHPKVLAASSDTIVDDFVANVNVGTFGSSKEQGLRAAKLALSDRLLDANAGFLRPGARLAVILVSDEDDCSDSANPPALIYPSDSDACHSDAEQALIDPVQQYVDFFQGTIGGEPREVFVAAIAGVDPVTKQPVQPPCNPGGYQGKRYKAFVDAFGARGYIDDVCLSDFTSTLTAIAGLIDPGQTVPLDGAPADWRMLTVALAKGSGTTVPCALALAGTPDAAGADAVYTPPEGDRAATLTFQGSTCKLEQGDRVDLKLLCAG